MSEDHPTATEIRAMQEEWEAKQAPILRTILDKMHADLIEPTMSRVMELLIRKRKIKPIVGGDDVIPP